MGNLVTARGTPTFSAGKFGNALNGCMRTATSAEWDSTVGTLEFWMKSLGATGVRVAVGNDGTASNGLWIGHDSTGKAAFGTTYDTSVHSSTITVNDGAWHHVAYVADGSAEKLYVDGVLGVNQARSGSQLRLGAGTTVVGGFGANSSFDFGGLVDEVRVSNSVRYTGAFTPPTAAFTSDANTRALYHLDSDGADSVPVPYRTNLCPNPSFELDLTGINGGSGTTVDRSTTGAQSGTYALRILGGPTDDSYGQFFNVRPWLPRGVTYTISATATVPAGFTGTNARARKLVVFHEATLGSGYTEVQSAAATIGATTRVSVTFTYAALGGDILIRFMNGSSSSSQAIYWDNVLVEATSTLDTYFDGDTPDAGGIDYAWTGTPHASSSTATLTAVSVSAPVLTAVSAMPAPTVSVAAAGTTVTPPVLASSSALLVPTVSAVTTVSVAAPVLALVAAMPAPTVVAVTSGVAAPTLALVSAMLAPVIETDTEAESTTFDDVVLEDLLYVELTAAADLDIAVPILSEKHPSPVLTEANPTHQAWVDYTPTTSVVGFAHLWVDGVDLTYFRGKPTLVRNWTKEAPWGDKTAMWEMPQLDPWDVPGEGDLSFIRKGAKVVIGIVDDETGAITRKWSGFYHSRKKGFDSAEDYVFEAHGTMWAAMFQAIEPVPYQAPVDIGVLIPRLLNKMVGAPFHNIPETRTGLRTRYRGTRDEKVWQAVQNILAKDGWTADGRQWTLRQVADDEFRMVLKSAMTHIDGTVSWGNPAVDFDLTIDEDSRVDGVFCRWVNPKGGESANVKYPGLELLNGLPYPNSDAGVFLNLGTTDADTTSGTGVSDWQRKAIQEGYTRLRVTGVMSAAWVDVVRDVQAALHITVDGSIGPQTWTATFTTVDESIDLTPRRLPMAVKPTAWPTVDGANGQILRANPAFDGMPPQYVYLDMGTNITRPDVAKLAKTYLNVNADAVVTGTAQFRGCLDDLARTDLDIGDNIKVRGFEGADVVLQVGRLSVDLDTTEGAYVVSVDADERARDALTIDQILERNRDALADPARRPGNPNRTSRLVRDEGFSWDYDSPCGRLPRTAVNGDTGLWTRRVIPFAEIGQLSGIRLHSTVPFAMMLMASLRYTPNMARRDVGNPFASSDPYRPHMATLESYGFLGAWGHQGDACGYSGGQEADGYGFTGLFTDMTTLEYVTETGPYVSVLLYARGDSGFVWGFEDGDGFLPARQT